MVMFRDFAKRNARRLGLIGAVQNMLDGSVRVVAEGEKDKLERLLVVLNKGPWLARVDNVKVVWEEASGKFSKFDIVH